MRRAMKWGSARIAASARVRVGWDRVAAGAGLARATREPFVLYERSGEVSIGFGAAAEIVLTRSEIRCRGLGGRGDRWSGVRTSDQPMRQVGELRDRRLARVRLARF